MANARPQLDPPVLLTEAHDSSSCASGETVLDEWLQRRAWSNLQAAASRTYVVCPTGALTIVGYAAVSMGQIRAEDTIGSMRRNMPQFIPAVILGRLAIDSRWQGKGLGRALLADVVARAVRVSSEISARLVIVHAISTAAETFYLRYGFTRLPLEPPTLALDLTKLPRRNDRT